MPFKAVFFDRDNTLVYADPAISKRRDALFYGFTGARFDRGYDEMLSIFDEAAYPHAYFAAHCGDEDACVREEYAFWLRYYACKLRRAGAAEGVDAMAAKLRELMWLKGLIPYPETVETLEGLKERGYLLGVISDTSPSLRLTLEEAGLSGFFSSFTCSDLAGAMKPEPLIYIKALASLGVRADEALYVDDYDVEAAGARALGMTAFHISRQGADKNESAGQRWEIRSLRELNAYAMAMEKKEETNVNGGME